MTADLVDFIRARLDEDEQIARTAAGDGDGQWTRDGAPYYDSGRIEDASRCRVIVYDEGAPDGDEAAHIVRHDPKRVLAEVEAKRQIVAEHDTAGWTTGDRLHDCQWRERPCQTLRLLAAPYADHPDYRPEWAPAAE